MECFNAGFKIHDVCTLYVPVRKSSFPRMRLWYT